MKRELHHISRNQGVLSILLGLGETFLEKYIERVIPAFHKPLLNYFIG
jgi:hypothetical protein